MSARAAAAFVTLAACQTAATTPAAPTRFEDIMWFATDIAGQPPLPGGTPSALFADGQVSGTTGCNRFGGPYVVTPLGLRIGPVAATKRACEPALNAQESRFARALEGDRAIAIGSDGSLTIGTGEAALRFSAQPAGR